MQCEFTHASVAGSMSRHGALATLCIVTSKHLRTQRGHHSAVRTCEFEGRLRPHHSDVAASQTIATPSSNTGGTMPQRSGCFTAGRLVITRRYIASENAACGPCWGHVDVR